MKISTRTRYGVRLMIALAADYNQGPVSLKDISKHEEISEKYLSQIIIPLRAKGLVLSVRGAGGGYVLSRPPNRMRLREVIEALVGDLTLVECLEDSSKCERVDICRSRDMWSLLGQKLIEFFDSYSLKDLVEMQKEKMKKVINYEI